MDYRYHSKDTHFRWNIKGGWNFWARYALWVRGQRNNSEKVHHQLPRTRTRLTHSFSTPAGQIFFIVEDLKNYSQMKVDSTGRAILAVLRNCGRLRESRGGGLVRYVIQV